ncbi:MAG: glycosyltransferase, partial [Sphingobacterium sp.]
EKSAEQRKRLLSIRPYASRKYANDLTVKAIVELSKRDFFKELEIALIGDGELFDQITEPVKGFSNVKLERRFLSHKEIAAVHKDYGIFITPTRMDSQGVSRDEAMSSGLVPVTTDVTAIPEFVSNDCGMLVDGEDYMGMASAIESLYRSPERFLELSRNASERVRRQSGIQNTIVKEIEIIKMSQ